MKKEYMKPTTLVVELRHKTCLLQASITGMSTNLTGDDAINYRGAGSGYARVRSNGGIDWDDDWSE